MSGQEVAWGWDFTLQMDLWKARQHNFLSDVTLVFLGESYRAHKLLLCIRSLPFAQLIEREGTGTATIQVDSLFEEIPDIGIDADFHVVFKAVLEFIATDWLADVPTAESLFICEFAKILQIPFLFSLASAKLLKIAASELSWWPVIINCLWVPDDTDFAKMLLDHVDEDTLNLPFDYCISIARSSPAAALKSQHLRLLRIEALCALLADDFPECQLSSEHLEHLLLQAALSWVRAHPQHIHIMTLIKMPLLPAGALQAELEGFPLQLSAELLDEGAKAPTPALAQSLVSASGGVAQAPGSVLWRLVKRLTARDVKNDTTADNLGLDMQPQPRKFTPSMQTRDQNSVRKKTAPHHQQLLNSHRSQSASSYQSNNPSSIPLTVLQNDGKPPPRFHQYVVITCLFVFSKKNRHPH